MTRRVVGKEPKSIVIVLRSANFIRTCIGPERGNTRQHVNTII